MQIDIRGPRPYLPARVNDGVPRRGKKEKDGIYAIAMIHVSCRNGRAHSSSKSHSTHNRHHTQLASKHLHSVTLFVSTLLSCPSTDPEFSVPGQNRLVSFNRS